MRKSILLSAALLAVAPLAQSAGTAVENASLIKFIRVTGVTYIKDGDQILSTLRAGAQLPDAPDNRLQLSVADGRAELMAGDTLLTAATGTEFGVLASSATLEINNTVAKTPLQLKTRAGNIILLTQGTTFKASPQGVLSVEKGKALFTVMATGETKVLAAGSTVKEEQQAKAAK